MVNAEKWDAKLEKYSGAITQLLCVASFVFPF